MSKSPSKSNIRLDKRRNKQRNVATCGIHGVGTIGQRTKASRQAFQRASILMRVAGDQQTRGQFGQRLIVRGDNGDAFRG